MTAIKGASEVESTDGRLEQMNWLRPGDPASKWREPYIFILIIAMPFCWLLFAAFIIGQPITVTAVITVCLPFVVILPLFLVMRRERLRNTHRSETGFCVSCGHEIPPGERGKNCQECGKAYSLIHDTKVRVQKTPALFWSELLFVILFPLAMMAPTFTLRDDGFLGIFRTLGFNPYAYHSTSGLVAAAESDWQGGSGVWAELQTQTLTADQRERLANTVLAYREDPELSAYSYSSAARWLAAAIGKGTLSTPTLTQVLASSRSYNDPSCSAAFNVLAVRTLSADEQAALLEVIFTALEDPQRRLDMPEHTLEDWFTATGNLTPAQLDRARACNWIPELVVPDRIRVDEPVEIILGQGDRFGSSGSLLAKRWLTIAVEGVAIDEGPFEDFGFEPVLVLYSGSAVDPEQNDAKNRVFPIELVFSEPGIHVIRIRYALFDGQRSLTLPSSLERAADGSLLRPDGAEWILERVFEQEIMVEAD
jgi:hypothetical protein